MSEGHQGHEHTNGHEPPAPAPAPFRFEAFADAASAQAAFDAAFPPDSSVEPALQALIDMGAQCKSVGPGRVACRYLETHTPLAGFTWHVVLDCTSDKAIKGVGISLAILGP